MKVVNPSKRRAAWNVRAKSNELRHQEMIPPRKAPTNRRNRHRIEWLLCLLVAVQIVFLNNCQATGPRPVTLIDGESQQIITTEGHTPGEILEQTGMALADADQLLLDGLPWGVDQPIPGTGPRTLQIQRAVPVTLSTPDGPRVLLTAASTVGAALREAGYQLYAVDFLDPPADSPISPNLSLAYRPAQPLDVSTANGSLSIRSAATTVGAALAQAGLALQGMDYSLPAETDPLPPDGLIRVVRVTESLRLVQNTIPFTSEFIASAEVELDQQQILQPGISGLSVSRVRIRYEDGQEVSRQTEAEATVRQPQNRVVGYGTKVTVRTASVGGTQIEYWRALNLFATSYSPCRSAADRCYHGTSSGKPVARGVVAVKYSWYLLMQGQPVFIPGYGYATIEDVGGGIPGTPWIDLGYSDNDWVEWGDWVTVYFLTPVPASVPYLLD